LIASSPSADYLDVSPLPVNAFPRKSSSASATIIDLYGGASPMGSRNAQRECLVAAVERGRGTSVSKKGSSAAASKREASRDKESKSRDREESCSSPNSSPGDDPRKSKKFLNQWKQAASMSKIGEKRKGGENSGN
jgi:hypothetical protein